MVSLHWPWVVVLAVIGTALVAAVVLAASTYLKTMRRLQDYAGELQLRASLRLTDRGASGTGTLADLVLPATAACTPTLDPLAGSACNLATTADALVPGMVDEGARAVWQLGSFEVLDADGRVFARPGLFVP